tara:strand:+ start:9813 stop:11009 length:1197 start_codon:yes stop_codon:yes gene_type:complete
MTKRRETEMEDHLDEIVIVGAGTAGVNVASALRQLGFEGQVVILGAESVTPYQRPPLSKTFLAKDQPPAATPLKPEAFFSKSNITLEIGQKVVAIDRAAKTVQTKTGDRYPYDALILATGSSARRLRCPGANLSNVCYLRNLSDAGQLHKALRSAKSVAILGGGVIGLEVASAAVAQEKLVTVIEAAGRVMARVATPSATNVITRQLEAAGVRFALNARLAHIDGVEGRARACILENGEEVAADLIVVGIGAVPNQGLAVQAGLLCGNGIIVDEAMRSSDPDIYAIGDCAAAENLYLGGRIRIETIHNAMMQAQVAASSICGVPAPDAAPPRFWSDLLGMKLQGLGGLMRYDRLVTSHGKNGVETEVHAFAGERLVATETINLPKRQSELSKLIHLVG